LKEKNSDFALIITKS